MMFFLLITNYFMKLIFINSFFTIFSPHCIIFATN